MTSKSIRPSAISLLGNAQLHTLALWQTDPWLLASDNENVRFTCREFIVDRVLDVDDVEASVVAFTVSDDADTTHVATTSGHGDHSSVKADEVLNFA